MQLTFRPGVALLAGALGLGACLTSCNGGRSYSKTKSGIEYKVFHKEGGKYVPKQLTGDEDPTYKDRQGKFLLAYVSLLTGKDSVINSSRQQLGAHPVPLPLVPVTKKGGQEEIYSLVAPGDSVVFRIQADSVIKKPQPIPGWLKKSGNVFIMRVVGDKVVDRAQAMAAAQELQQIMRTEQQRKMREATAEQDKKDDVTLQDYIKKNNLAATKKSPSGSGVYILTTQPGSGPNIKPGQQVSVQYRGTLLDGKEFDSSAKSGKPFNFTVGRGEVISGWDDAVQQLQKGSKATILIPSSLAYGPMGQGAIPANSPLRFDIEVVNVLDAPAMSSAAPTLPAPAK